MINKSIDNIIDNSTDNSVYMIAKIEELTDQERVVKLYKHVKELESEIVELKRKLRKKDEELRHYWKLAQSWMQDYDKMVAKYEPKEVKCD